MNNLDDMSVAEMSILWQQTFNRPAPMRADWFLRGNLRYAQQCKLHGQLTSFTQAKLKAMARGNVNPTPMRPGVKFLREWRGETHEVEVLATGMFDYRGKQFRSLSGVARHITGTTWNGKTFFGVQKATA